jgi:hypothetical protein
VRLIAGFHGGVAMATNLDDGSGVEVSVEFPLEKMRLLKRRSSKMSRHRPGVHTLPIPWDKS